MGGGGGGGVCGWGLFSGVVNIMRSGLGAMFSSLSALRSGLGGWVIC